MIQVTQRSKSGLDNNIRYSAGQDWHAAELHASSVDPVARQYDAARRDGLTAIDAALWTLPAVAQATRPATKEAVQERLRAAGDFRFGEQRTSVAEMLLFMNQRLPITVSYPGWIMAGAVAEMLWLLLTSEREFMVSQDGRAARGLGELDIAIRRIWDVRLLVSGKLRNAHEVLRPHELEHARQGLWETISLLRGLPIDVHDYVEYVAYIELIERYLEAGEDIVTAGFSIEPTSRFILTAALGAELVKLDDDLPGRDGSRNGSNGASDEKPDRPDIKLCPKISVDKDGKPSVSVELKPGEGITLEDILKFIKDSGQAIVDAAEVVGKVLSSLVIFWLFLDDDDEAPARPVTP